MLSEINPRGLELLQVSYSYTNTNVTMLCFGRKGNSPIFNPNHEFTLSLSVPRCFYPVFFHIQMLWELVLLGEALVVMAPSPAESSDTVLALVR